ncbi:MAG: ATP-binding domain-containing protein [Lachnospiraceae bacterium]|nr:ATP-binding domain-containing protein [Lachnospiraceae bacterium]
MPKFDKMDTSREHEEQYLVKVREAVDENCSVLDDQIGNGQAVIEALTEQYLEHFDKEIKDLLDSEINLMELAQKERAKNGRAKAKPYFGRILFDDESMYIGRGGIRKNVTDILVADWRAPISNAYYENGLGEASFKTPTGENVTVNVKLKRTFDIKDGTLIDYYDSEAAMDDELLNKYLAKNKQAVLNEIIATIQKEQNEIIRLSPRSNLIVQGVAGSGKTTVAMHRISYLLYNYEDILKPQDFYVIGSNKMLLKYITGVLPELDVNGFGQMTMEELFTRLMYEDWDSFRYDIRETDNSDPKACLKGTSAFFEKLKNYCDLYENNHIPQEDVVLDGNQFTEGFENGIMGVYDRRDNPTGRKGKPITLLRGSAIASYIKNNPKKSMLVKIRLLNEEIMDNIESSFGSMGISFTEKEKAAIRKAYDEFLGKKVFKGSIYDIYEDFLKEQDEYESMKPSVRYDERIVTGKGKSGNKTAKVKITEYDVYDLAALAYIYHRIKEEEVICEARHIVIDEAQDYGMMAYLILNDCMRECKYTIMGDVSQNIRYDSGLNDWQELRELFLSGENDCFMMLKKSYRNTIEISNFATKILEHGSFEIYPCEPIIRHGTDPEFIRVEDSKTNKKINVKAADKVVELCKDLLGQEMFSIAVVCRNKEKAKALSEYLKDRMDIIDLDDENAEYGQGVMVLPVNMTKGLEFDAVIIFEPTKEDYPEDNRHVKLLYVAATRALHKLIIIHSSSLSGLLENPASEGSIKYFKEDRSKTFIGYEERARLEEERQKFLENEELLSKQKVMSEAEARTKRYLESRTGASKANVDAKRGSEKDLTDRKKEVSGQDGKLSKKKEEADTTGQTGKNRPDTEKPGDKDFLSQVPEELLKPAGHAVGSFATKWVRKQNDGIYFQSQNGIVRITPISRNIVRISFSRGPILNIPNNSGVKNFQMSKDFQYKENGQSVEINLKDIGIGFDKYRGSFTFRDSSKRELIKESPVEPRLVDEKRKPVTSFAYFEGKTSDIFYVLSSDGKLNYLNNKALFISEGNGRIPCVIKKEKYAIIPLTVSKAAFCRMPVVGTFLMQEDPFIDYYLVVDTDTDKLTEAYKKLTGC